MPPYSFYQILEFCGSRSRDRDPSQRSLKKGIRRADPVELPPTMAFRKRFPQLQARRVQWIVSDKIAPAMPPV